MKFSALIFFFLGFSVFFNSAYAESSYVLPYPSFMPGNKMYVLKEAFDDVNKYFYFGDFAQFKYHLTRSDKYLVEAKTLFEYKQYLLGVESLKKSDDHFEKAIHNLSQASKNNKNVQEKNKVLRTASFKHIDVLSNALSNVPEVETWNPEKGEKTVLQLKNMLEHSLTLRESCTE